MPSRHLSFKEHLLLSEARRPDLKYTQKEVKGKIDRVSTELSGVESANMTKLAKRYARLEVSLKALKEKHDELNTQLKGQVQELFDAEDVVLTRVVETAQFTLTMAKEIKKPDTQEKDYEAIITALSALISDELQPQVEKIIDKFTKVVPAKEPIKRLSVSKEVVKEGVWDSIVSVAKSFLRAMTAWATRYDNKLDVLKKKASNLRERDDSVFL